MLSTAGEPGPEPRKAPPPWAARARRRRVRSAGGTAGGRARRRGGADLAAPLAHPRGGSEGAAEEQREGERVDVSPPGIGADESEGCACNPTATIALQVLGLWQPPSPGEQGTLFHKLRMMLMNVFFSCRSLLSKSGPHI